MRMTWVVSLAVLASAASGVPGAAQDKDKPNERPEIKATEDDAKSINAAIEHFSEQKVNFAFAGRESKKVIVIHQASSGPGGIYLSDDQLRSDLNQHKWEVPADLRVHLRQRNANGVSLKTLKFGKGVLVADLEKVPPYLDGKDVPKAYVEAKAYAFVWLPGYSKDGSTAVVRFFFGPTPHGATATYLLTKKDGAWKVTKWAFAYYV